jgi:ribosomal protein S4E
MEYKPKGFLDVIMVQASNEFTAKCKAFRILYESHHKLVTKAVSCNVHIMG